MKKVELILQILFSIASAIVAGTRHDVSASIVWLIASIFSGFLAGYTLAEIMESEDTE